MNYGYIDLNGELPLELNPDDEEDRYFIQLYHHVATAVDIQGKDVLEVGSGRGGGRPRPARSPEPFTRLRRIRLPVPVPSGSISNTRGGKDPV